MSWKSVKVFFFIREMMQGRDRRLKKKEIVFLLHQCPKLSHHCPKQLWHWGSAWVLFTCENHMCLHSYFQIVFIKSPSALKCKSKRKTSSCSSFKSANNKTSHHNLVKSATNTFICSESADEKWGTPARALHDRSHLLFEYSWTCSDRLKTIQHHVPCDYDV